MEDLYFIEIKNLIQKGLELLPSAKTSMADAETKASEFLKIQSQLSEAVMRYEEDMHEIRSVAKMLYKSAIFSAEGKNATEKSASADADQDFSKADKTERALKSKVSYLKTHVSIFSDAHILCRQISKGQV